MFTPSSTRIAQLLSEAATNAFSFQSVDTHKNVPAFITNLLNEFSKLMEKEEARLYQAWQDAHDEVYGTEPTHFQD